MKCSIKSCQSEATSWSKLKPFCSKHSPFRKHHPKPVGGYLRYQRRKNKTHKCSAPEGILKILRGSNQSKVEVEDVL